MMLHTTYEDRLHAGCCPDCMVGLSGGSCDECGWGKPIAALRPREAKRLVEAALLERLTPIHLLRHRPTDWRRLHAYEIERILFEAFPHQSWRVVGGRR